MKIRVLQLVIGHVLLTLGIALIVLSRTGVGSWDTVYFGLISHFGQSYGTWSFIVQAILIGVNSLILWKRPEWKAVIGMVLSSLLIDLWLNIVFVHVHVIQLWMQIAMFAGGLALLSLGIAWYIRANIFSSPFDGLMMATAKRLRISLRSARVLNEFMAIGIGFLLGGGVVGIGTIVLSASLGLGIQLCMKALDLAKTKGIHFA